MHIAHEGTCISVGPGCNVRTTTVIKASNQRCTGWIDFYKKDYIKFAETEAQGPGLWNSDMGMTYKSLKRT